jgi:hypothetical protein
VIGASAPLPSLRYLARLSDSNGIVEHAQFDRPRREYGYCTDDAGRLLGLASRLPGDPDAFHLADVALGFLERAHREGAEFRLRQRGNGTWTEDRPSDDAAGRALFGLGTAVARAPWPELRRRALALFDEASVLRSEHLRAAACAALGAAELLRAEPAHAGARRLLSHAATLLGSKGTNETWPWPETRLSYSNALLPEASLSAAIVLGDPHRASSALEQLRWLVERQTFDGHFSFTPVGGSDSASTPPMFDQQPIEAWAMASACARAFAYTWDRRWAEAVQGAAAWFLGDNDVGVAVFDPVTGGGFDGLESDGVNRNEGAESSMAFVGTMLDLHELTLELEATPN